MLTSCTNCGAQAEKAANRNMESFKRLFCCFLSFMIAWPLLLNLTIQITVRLNY